MSSLEIDLQKVEMGQTVTVKWRGKPVFVRRRTEAEIEGARAVDVSSLRDPETDESRAKVPEVSTKAYGGNLVIESESAGFWLSLYPGIFQWCLVSDCVLLFDVYCPCRQPHAAVHYSGALNTGLLDGLV